MSERVSSNIKVYSKVEDRQLKDVSHVRVDIPSSWSFNYAECFPHFSEQRLLCAGDSYGEVVEKISVNFKK